MSSVIMEKINLQRIDVYKRQGYGPAGEWLPLWQKIAAVDYQYASRFDEMYEELMASPELTECRTYSVSYTRLSSCCPSFLKDGGSKRAAPESKNPPVFPERDTDGSTVRFHIRRGL